MPTVLDPFVGRSLVADVGPQLRGIGDFIVQQRDRREARTAQQEKQRTINEQIDILAGQFESPEEIQRQLKDVTPGTDPNRKPTSNQAALLRLNAIDPKIGKAVMDVISKGDIAQRERLRLMAERRAKDAVFVSGQKDFVGKTQAITSLAQAASVRGESIQGFVELRNLSEPQLDLELQRMMITGQDLKQILKAPGAGRFTKGTGVIVRLPDGTTARSIPSFNQATGEVENKIVPLGGEPISRLAETGQELTQRKIGEAGGVAEVRRKVELETAEPISGASTRGRAAETRQQGIINRGLDAADTVPILKRSIELLDSVKTGGFDAASLRAKQLFGIESADEAELSSGLGKAVLSQLRTTFGAAFTEREGARLATIEAGFGKSVEGNKRLLRQALRIAERAAERAIKAAERAGDFDTAQEIRAALDFSLSEPVPEETVAPEGPPEGATAINPTTGERLIFRGGQWQTQ